MNLEHMRYEFGFVIVYHLEGESEMRTVWLSMTQISCDKEINIIWLNWSILIMIHLAYFGNYLDYE